MQYPSGASVRPVDAISARCREILKRNTKRVIGPFRAATREKPQCTHRSAGAVFVFSALPMGEGKRTSSRDKTATKPRQKYDKKLGFAAVSAGQNRDKSETKNTALPLSQRVKTVSKVGQKSDVARCHGVAKPWQKWGKNPRLRVVTRRFPRQSISAGKRPFPGHRCKTSAGV